VHDFHQFIAFYRRHFTIDLREEHIVMASGDAQRAWFPEMIEALRARWYRGISWEEVSAFVEAMQRMRDEIRASRNIKPVRMLCKKCGQYTLATPPKVSIRSLLFALKKAGLVSDAEFKDLDKEWKKYRSANQLDLYGRKVTASNVIAGSCEEHQQS
jgi:hypothetical protein